ncbi:reverse transcriptase (RNA-dependent DNA polymerase) domain-containing protein [Phthorimaea operculella]|nr:reverse transcriptase (RNA-dependent DNA polymerase) domain-containing protein [Phthorimaea operculella]
MALITWVLLFLLTSLKKSNCADCPTNRYGEINYEEKLRNHFVRDCEKVISSPPPNHSGDAKPVEVAASNDDQSSFFPVTCGVKHGCVLAPKLFTLHCLRRSPHVFNLARFKARIKVSHALITEAMYADDLCFFAESPKGLQQLTTVFHHACCIFRLEISVKRHKNAAFWPNIAIRPKAITWKPVDYGGLETVTILSHYMWTPFLMHHNSRTNDIYEYEKGSFFKSFYLTCSSSVHGTVNEECCQFIPIMFMNAIVEAKRKDLYDAYNSAGWHIYNSQIVNNENPNETYQISLILNLKRVAEDLACTIFIPILLSSVLTVMTFTLNLDNNRLLLCCLSLLIHFWTLLDVSAEITKHSSDPPAILLFLRSSMFLTSFSIILTLYLKYLLSVKKQMSLRIKKVLNYVYDTKYKHYIWPRWEKESSTGKENAGTECERVSEFVFLCANLLDLKPLKTLVPRVLSNLFVVEVTGLTPVRHTGYFNVFMITICYTGSNGEGIYYKPKGSEGTHEYEQLSLWNIGRNMKKNMTAHSKSVS